MWLYAETEIIPLGSLWFILGCDNKGNKDSEVYIDFSWSRSTEIYFPSRPRIHVYQIYMIRQMHLDVCHKEDICSIFHARFILRYAEIRYSPDLKSMWILPRLILIMRGQSIFYAEIVIMKINYMSRMCWAQTSTHYCVIIRSYFYSIHPRSWLHLNPKQGLVKPYCDFAPICEILEAYKIFLVSFALTLHGYL